jgi:hypothetical protein
MRASSRSRSSGSWTGRWPRRWLPPQVSGTDWSTQYDRIDDEKVLSAARQALVEYRLYVSAIEKHLERESRTP